MDKIPKEQKIHDLSIAYATYSSSQSKEIISPDDFYQEYKNAYAAIEKIISHYE